MRSSLPSKMIVADENIIRRALERAGGQHIHRVTGWVMAYRGLVEVLAEHPELTDRYEDGIREYERRLARVALTGHP